MDATWSWPDRKGVTGAAELGRVLGMDLARRRLWWAGALLPALLGWLGCGEAVALPSEEEAWGAFQGQGLEGALERRSEKVKPGVEAEVFELPGAPRGRAVMLLFHGGGWTRGERSLLEPHARYFAMRGWACVNVGYRIAREGGATLDDQVEDVRAAMAWAREEGERRRWNLGRVVALGESAGGQLACALGVLPGGEAWGKASALVLLNPVVDLSVLSWTRNLPGIAGSGPFGGAGDEEHPYWRLSPVFHVAAGMPPTLVLHGSEDRTAPLEQIERFEAKARAVGAVVESHVLEGQGHAFLLAGRGMAAAQRDALRRIERFLKGIR